MTSGADSEMEFRQKQQLPRRLTTQSLNWIRVNVGSFAIASALAFGIASSFESYNSIVFAPFPGLLVNSIVGVSQAVLLSKDSKRLGLWWVFGTALSGLLGWWLALVAGLYWTVLFGARLYVYSDAFEWISVISAIPVGSLIMGACTGFAQMLVLRSHLTDSRRWWRAATIGRFLGWCSAIPLALVYGFLLSKGVSNLVITVPLAGSGGALLGFVYGQFTARVLEQASVF